MVTSCTIRARLPLRPTKLQDGVPTSNYRILVRRVGFEPTNPSSSSCLDSKGRDLSAKFSPTYLSPWPSISSIFPFSFAVLITFGRSSWCPSLLPIILLVGWQRKSTEGWDRALTALSVSFSGGCLNP